MVGAGLMVTVAALVVMLVVPATVTIPYSDFLLGFTQMRTSQRACRQ